MKTVVWFAFGNIANTTYCIILMSDGSLTVVNTGTAIGAQVMPPGTILNPSSIMGFAQWGSQYFLFAKDQTNGYWIYDGTNLYGSGTVGPIATLTDDGTAYTSTPTITVYGGSGTGVTATATLDNQSVSQVMITNPGTGFAIGDTAGMQFSGGGAGTTALATPAIEQGAVTGIQITNGGSGFQNIPGLVIDPPPAGGHQAFAHVTEITGGVITGIAMDAFGFGYTTPPNVTTAGGDPLPGSLTPIMVGVLVNGSINTATVTDPGSQYFEAPQVLIFGDGEGAEATATVANGQVTGVSFTAGGSGYTKATIVLAGGNNGASGFITIMPFGVSGTAVETYGSRVWISNGAAVAQFPPPGRVIFSAAGTPVDFGDGGGAFLSNDSFLKVGYYALRQSNGFLYLIGDSSLNYVSGVTTSGTPAITTFNNQNVDPQLGSPWPNSVQVFSRNIVFANHLGIFVSYGGAVTKVSAPLDGFYTSVPETLGVIQPSGAVAEIFGIQVYMLLLPVIDQYTGQQVNKLLMWDGKLWWTSQQDVALTFVTTREFDSRLTAWGTDGNGIYPLFTTPSSAFQKVVRSKLWSNPSYINRKTIMQVHGIVYQDSTDTEAVTLFVDNESQSGSPNNGLTLGVGGLIWTNNLGNPIVWNLSWSSPGLSVFGPQAIGQVGRTVGLTLATYDPNLTIVSITLLGQQRESRT